MNLDVSVVVVSHNTREDLVRCLGSIQQHVQLPHEVLVVDNASHDGSLEVARAAFPAARLIPLAENVGFSRANNLGIQSSQGRFLLILNSDAQVRSGTVETLAEFLKSRPDVGVVGPRTRDPDGTIQVSFGQALTPRSEWKQRRLLRGVDRRRPWALRKAEAQASREREPDWVSASCFLIRREAVEAVGGFDEGFFLYEEDVDLCDRLRNAGWRVLFTPAAEVIHSRGRSMETAPDRVRFEYHRSHLRYYRKHNGGFAIALLRLRLASAALAAVFTASLRVPLNKAARTDGWRLLDLALFGRP